MKTKGPPTVRNTMFRFRFRIYSNNKKMDWHLQEPIACNVLYVKHDLWCCYQNYMENNENSPGWCLLTVNNDGSFFFFFLFANFAVVYTPTKIVSAHTLKLTSRSRTEVTMVTSRNILGIYDECKHSKNRFLLNAKSWPSTGWVIKHVNLFNRKWKYTTETTFFILWSLQVKSTGGVVIETIKHL